MSKAPSEDPATKNRGAETQISNHNGHILFNDFHHVDVALSRLRFPCTIVVGAEVLFAWMGTMEPIEKQQA